MDNKFKKLFDENGFQVLHVTNVAIEVVLKELCKSLEDLEYIIPKYNIDWTNTAVYKIYCEFTQIEDDSEYTYIPVKKMDIRKKRKNVFHHG